MNRETGWSANWRLHCALIVAAALLAAPLTVVLAQAQKQASDKAVFRKLVEDVAAAWSTGDADNPAKFYAKDANLVFYDIAPFSYHGWKEYHDGVQKNIFENMASGKLTAEKEFTVTRRGTLAWTTASEHLSMTEKDGKKVELDLRVTDIWERRGGQWLIVHEHVSAPLP